MPKLAKVLSALEVSRLKVAGMHFVGEVPGLALNVGPTGARSWVLRMKVGGRRRDIGLGGYPAVTLAEARGKAREARDGVSKGVDPIEAKKAARSALEARQAAAKTFDQCVAAFLTLKEREWSNAKHAAQWRATLETYASPVIGSMLVRDIGTAQVMEVLSPIWTTKTETAGRVRGRIESVLDYAIVHGLRPEPNPARWRGQLDKLLPKPSKVAPVEHFVAVPVAEVGAFMAHLRDVDAMGARCLEFLIMTATRSGEARSARWTDIDLDAKVWTIPAPKMKAKRAHRVPLSSAAVALLKALPRFEDETLVFPSRKSGAKLSDMTLTQLMRRAKVTGFDRHGNRAPAVPHGFRSTFRDWAAERTAHPREAVEQALAHIVANATEAAYFRSDLFERRRQLMDDWAGFLARVERPAQVIELQRRKA
ncbi:integrase arm-type DNA-binding domain-containing protein [Azohydromonas sp.]|uniref:tyrosine-type recombinase/integrase n=1 Tax=Azohydromonas sp. TaxID=1872666 RepID=UPI002CEEF93F|nr:integrase arm-type DNA-binding domain-containing protein [Azohydromonas sp.]HMM85778.1 integrase arm-type DNA-binding domain-containing protein [Azohydromonas sp.]